MTSYTLTLPIKTKTLVLNVSTYITRLAVLLVMIFVSTFISTVLYIGLARYIFLERSNNHCMLIYEFFCFLFNRSRTILDDFREAYFWLRQNTGDKARVMSWWDYGYQIAGMGNRTTLVDNNTWNNSHIALVSLKNINEAEINIQSNLY